MPRLNFIIQFSILIVAACTRKLFYFEHDHNSRLILITLRSLKVYSVITIRKKSCKLIFHFDLVCLCTVVMVMAAAVWRAKRKHLNLCRSWISWKVMLRAVINPRYYPCFNIHKPRPTGWGKKLRKIWVEKKCSDRKLILYQLLLTRTWFGSDERENVRMDFKFFGSFWPLYCILNVSCHSTCHIIAWHCSQLLWLVMCFLFEF